MPDSNEIHHRWESEGELLNALSTNSRDVVQRAGIQSMINRFDGADTVA